VYGPDAFHVHCELFQSEERSATNYPDPFAHPCRSVFQEQGTSTTKHAIASRVQSNYPRNTRRGEQLESGGSRYLDTRQQPQLPQNDLSTEVLEALFNVIPSETDKSGRNQVQLGETLYAVVFRRLSR
jgi:hypothetical protein